MSALIPRKKSARGSWRPSGIETLTLSSFIYSLSPVGNFRFARHEFDPCCTDQPRKLIILLSLFLSQIGRSGIGRTRHFACCEQKSEFSCSWSSRPPNPLSSKSCFLKLGNSSPLLSCRFFPQPSAQKTLGREAAKKIQAPALRKEKGEKGTGEGGEGKAHKRQDHNKVIARKFEISVGFFFSFFSSPLPFLSSSLNFYVKSRTLSGGKEGEGEGE